MLLLGRFYIYIYSIRLDRFIASFYFYINRYALHLSDVYNLFEIANKGTVTYYIDFLFEISVILIDLLHYLHMLVSVLIFV